jgi:hypothetical protein
LMGVVMDVTERIAAWNGTFVEHSSPQRRQPLSFLCIQFQLIFRKYCF